MELKKKKLYLKTSTTNKRSVKNKRSIKNKRSVKNYKNKSNIIKCSYDNNCFYESKIILEKIKKFRSSIIRKKSISKNDYQIYKKLYSDLKKAFFKKKVINCIKNNCSSSIELFINQYNNVVPYFKKVYLFSSNFDKKSSEAILLLNEVSFSIIDFFENLYKNLV